MEGVITGAFAEILQANRPALNARFATARNLRPGLEPEAFADILRELVTPIVTAAEQCSPAAARTLALTLYDLSLDLLGQGFLGPQSRYPFIAQGWQRLLPRLPQQLCAAPRLVTVSLTNALYNLSQTPGSRPNEWLETMLALAPLAPDPHQYLQAGQVAAWWAGLAHFRSGALEICQVLPADLVYTALRLPPGEAESALPLVDRLAADPWLDADSAKNQPRQNLELAVVRRVGAFRGFGGDFIQPPQVFSAGEHFIVADGETHWLLVADVFGATLHRIDGFQPQREIKPFEIDQSGRVRFANLQQKFDDLAGYSSAASNGKTLAVTSALSFAVTLIAPVEA
jgi:hypothetical protein